MRKSLIGLGLALALLSGCTPSDPAISPTPAATTTTSQNNSELNDVASVDLTAPGKHEDDPVVAPDEVGYTEVKTGMASDSAAGDVALKAQQAHQSEQRLASLALEKSTNREVLEAARMIAMDHKRAEIALRDALLTGLPAKARLSQEQEQLANKLDKLSGAPFDKAYINAMVTEHAEDLKFYQQQSKEAPTEALRDYFVATAPVIESHLKHCKKLQAKLG